MNDNAEKAKLVSCIHCNGTGTDPVGSDGRDPDNGPCYLCNGKRKITIELRDLTIRIAEMHSTDGTAFG